MSESKSVLDKLPPSFTGKFKNELLVDGIPLHPDPCESFASFHDIRALTLFFCNFVQTMSREKQMKTSLCA